MFPGSLPSKLVIPFFNLSILNVMNEWISDKKVFRSSTFMKKDIGTYISIGWLLLNRFFFNYFFQLFHVFIINYFVYEFFIRQKMIDDQLYFSHFVTSLESQKFSQHWMRISDIWSYYKMWQMARFFYMLERCKKMLKISHYWIKFWHYWVM